MAKARKGKNAGDADGRPAPPADLSPGALQEWDRICTELAAAGQLAGADRALLTLYVETWDINRQAMRHVCEYGAVIKHHNGVAGPSPFYKVSRETSNQLRALLAELQLTPAARAKAKTPADDDDDGDLDLD